VRIVLLAGGVGGARFTRGVRDHLRRTGTAAQITVVVNTGDDLWLDGLRVCPDLDTVMYTLAGVVHPAQGWGRAGETTRVTSELHAYGLGWEWFTLGDLDIATHVARTGLLRAGRTLSEVTTRLGSRWDLGARLVPMTDAEVETWVEVRDEEGVRQIHFEEWWVRHRAEIPARRFVQRGVEEATAAPGVLEALASADVVLLPPSNPVVSVGTVLGVPGIEEALRASPAPVIGVSPLIDGRPVRGMADACLRAVGVDATTAAVARHYGARADGGLLDGWLVDDADAGVMEEVRALGLDVRALPLLMRDDPTTAAIVSAALHLAARHR
jgi:LPPG:FO 2-phospho-L-lactate transferase